MGAWSRPRMAAGADPGATAVVMQLERTEQKVERHLIALVNAQLETNRLLAAVLVRLGGQP
jgi:hypothetical protein